MSVVGRMAVLPRMGSSMPSRILDEVTASEPGYCCILYSCLSWFLFYMKWPFLHRWGVEDFWQIIHQDGRVGTNGHRSAWWSCVTHQPPQPIPIPIPIPITIPILILSPYIIPYLIPTPPRKGSFHLPLLSTTSRRAA